MSACASSVPRTIPRVVDGRVEEGPPISPYAYEWFIEGELRAAEGRHDEAALAFESAAAAPTSDVFLMTRLAEEYEWSGATRRADRALSIADRGYPESARVALAQGHILEHRGELDAAFDAFARAKERAPSWAEPVVAIARALESQGLSERAAAVLWDYLSIDRGRSQELARTALMDLARRTGNAEMLERALAFDSSTTPERRARIAAELALSVERPALAARILQGELDDHDNVTMWLHALQQSGEGERAAQYVASAPAARWAGAEDRAELLVDLHAETRALELLAAAERTPRVQLTRGAAFAGRGELVQAASTFASVPYGAAPFERSRLDLSDCSSALLRAGGAVEALSVTPHGSLPVRERLAEFYLDEDDLRAGLRLFDARQTSERAALAGLFERAGHYEEAAAFYASVPVSSSSEPRIRARASAEHLAARGDRESAIAILKRWAAVAPEDLYSRARLVELLQAERRTAEAANLGRETLSLADDPRLEAHLAALLRAPDGGSR